jgi:hypothetical protein
MWDCAEWCQGLVEGFQVLQLRGAKCNFLIRCCEKILHNIDSTHLIGPSYPVLVDVPNLLDYKKSCSSFAEAARRAAYVSCRAVNVPRITYLAAAVLQNAKDHLLGLQEDPGYFANALRSHQEHHLGPMVDSEVPGAYGSHHSLMGKQLHIFTTSCSSIMYWSPINERISILDKFNPANGLSKMDGDTFSGLVVSHDMLDALIGLLTTIAGLLVDTQFTFQAFRRKAWIGDDHDGSGHSDKSEPGVPADTVTVTVYNLLCRIPQQQPYLEGLYTLLDHLESYCQREPDARGWITPMVESVLTPLSIATECIIQLRAMVP